MANKLIIDTMLTIDETGMPQPPDVRQLLDKDIRELYTRDKSKDHKRYIQEAIVIYYLGDPKSPAKQAGLSDAEALKMAIEQADLRKDYIPDALVLKIIKRYYEQNIGEAGRTVENILKGIHNVNVAIDVLNQLLNEKLKTVSDVDTIEKVLGYIDDVNKKAGEMPALVKKLNDAKENLMYEKETELSRGGGTVTSSMDAEAYIK